MNRRRLAVVALIVAVLLSGCSFFGGGEISEDSLLGDREYDWDTNVTASFDLDDSSDSYTAIIKIEDRSTLEVYQKNRLRSNSPISINDLKFRFANGTVVNATHDGLTASRGSDQTKIELPADNGTVAFASSRNGKSWSTPAYVEGSYKVFLPAKTDVGIPLLSEVSPDAEKSETEDGRTVLHWDDIDEGNSISVRYYLIRDLYIFGTLLAVGISLAAGGITYYYRQIKRARKKREEVGLDVEDEDTDLDDGPPPGMG
jgi:hypothetical protein